MKDRKLVRIDSPGLGPFKGQGGDASTASETPARVNFRQRRTVASEQPVRQLSVARPPAKPTFRMTLDR